jgi:hypothetical protein
MHWKARWRAGGERSASERELFFQEHGLLVVGWSGCRETVRSVGVYL